MRAKEIRLENTCTQKDIANHLDVSRATYSMWENELDLFPIRRLDEFCDYFNVSFDYVLNLYDTKKYQNMHKIDIKSSAERLKALRIKNKLTQAKLADILTIDQSLVSKYEKGTVLISTTFVEAYSRKFCVSTDYLLGRIDKEIKIKPKPVEKKEKNKH